MASYVDVEEFLVTWLKTRCNYPNVVTGIPTNVAFVTPCIAVSRFGGGDDTITIDRANVDVDVLAADYPGAKTVAEDIRRAFRTRLVRYATSSATVIKVETISAPLRRPWDSRNLVHRVGATYRVSLHQFAGV